MKEESKPYHMKVLAQHQANMYNTLIWHSNLITETACKFKLEDENEAEKDFRGYFALKERDGRKVRYFMEDDIIPQLPIRVKDSEEWFYKDSTRKSSVVQRVVDFIPFRITPENCFPDTHKFIDMICPFDHTKPEFFTFAKINAISGYISKTLTCVCGTSEFGKTSVYEVLDGITQKCPVFNPKTAAATLMRLTEDGNLIIDEMQKVASDIKIIIEGIATKIGDDRPTYHNGSLKTNLTKNNYNISEQSMTFTYNPKDYYSDPEENFFDGSNFWDNVAGMDSRFLKFKVEGALKEQFDKNFDILVEAEKNKMIYMRIAKQLLYLKKLRLSNNYARKYDVPFNILLPQRKKSTLNEITWLLDMYCDSKKEYEDYIGLIEKSIKGYADMIGKSICYTNEKEVINEQEQLIVKDEIIGGDVCTTCQAKDASYWLGSKVYCSNCYDIMEASKRK